MEKVKCEICEVAHKTDRKARVCIVEKEFKAWVGYACSMPRGSGVGMVEAYDRFTNHIYPVWYWSWIRHYIRYRDDHRCKSCGVKTHDGEVHHIRPRSKGGLDNPDNLIYLCMECHKEHTKKLVSKKVKGGEVLANPMIPMQKQLEG